MFARVQVLYTNILLISPTAVATSECLFLLLSCWKEWYPAYFFFMYDGLHALILLLPNNVVVRVHLLTPTTLGLGFWVWATFLFFPCHFIALKEEATYLLLLPAGFSLNVPRTWRGAAWTEQATWIFFVGLQGTLAWLFDVCGRRHHLELTVLRIVMTSNRQWSPVSGVLIESLLV